MKKIHKKIKLLFAVSFLLPVSVLSADLFKADKYYTNKQYDLAIAGYLEAAKLGSSHAYYQLANIYTQGLGVEKDGLNALIYFSLAAEQNFYNAKAIRNKMLSGVSPEQKTSIDQVLVTLKQKQRQIDHKYFPILITENLDKKISFEGRSTLDRRFYIDELDIDLIDDYSSDLSFDNEDSSDSPFSALIINKQPFLILDHDIASDGSIRNISEVQRIGSAKSFIQNYSLFPIAKPSFNNRPIEFVHRSYMGMAVYDKFQLAEENKSLYREIIRLTKKYKNSDKLNEQYQYAMALLNFTWLADDPNEAETRLKLLANKGHPGAMYEYGFKLYREQRQIPEALKWISEASKYGLARAEYRLANIFQTSPWVVHDEFKALFWYESAMEKAHSTATLKAAEIKLLAKNTELRNLNDAIAYLDKIKTVQADNPEYYYLLALSHKDRKNRDFTQVVQNLEKAISMGKRANWDVSHWQSTLSKLTTGSVYIVE